MDTKDVKRQTSRTKPAGKRPVRRSGGTKTASRPAAATGRRSASVKTTRRTKPATPKRPPDSQIVYTPPKPFNRGRFVIRLATAAAIVLALVFGMSIFFKVETVNVAGTDKYTPWDIQQASGIHIGEGLLGLSKAKIAGKIIEQLPYVDDVQIGIKLPDTVNIEITELDIVYSVQAQDDTWWLVNAQGRVVDKTDSATGATYTQLLGLRLNSPVIGEMAVAVEPEPGQTDAEGQTVPVTVKGSERLETVITILQYLEANGVIGQADSVNVEDMGDIRIEYADRYEVLLGDTTQLGYKIKSFKAAVDQMGDYQSGTLDASFTIWPDEVGYTPAKEVQE